jgi:hypothetical protein
MSIHCDVFTINTKQHNVFEKAFQRRLLRMGAPALKTSSPLNEESKSCSGLVYDKKRKRFKAKQRKKPSLWIKIMRRSMGSWQYCRLYPESKKVIIRNCRVKKGSKRKRSQKKRRRRRVYQQQY